ncbi:MAG: hypothetical protein KME30_29970 [Iphinoe sp. HA4291-MV1]|jgi:hypothetical protein|nr:hypothetical protein [Iphinoe sp. HA4291-MV1]
MDFSIYDDPNVLVGDPKVERYAIAKSNINLTLDLMPVNGNTYDEFVQILKEWYETKNYTKWVQAFDYFSTLKMKDYLWLLTYFPQIFLKKPPNTLDSERKKLFKNYSDGYVCCSKLLASDFLGYDIPPNPLLKGEIFKLYKPEVKVKFEKLNLCQGLIHHSLGEFFKGTFVHGANLWFWWEVSDCLKKVDNLLNPKDVNSIRSKKILNDVEGKRVDYLAGFSRNTDIYFKEIKGIKDLFYHLGDFVESNCRAIANQDTDFQDGVLTNYESARRIARRTHYRSKEYQYVCTYCNQEKIEVFISTQGRKLPFRKN